MLKNVNRFLAKCTYDRDANVKNKLVMLKNVKIKS